jgi:hypothetical protein
MFMLINGRFDTRNRIAGQNYLAAEKGINSSIKSNKKIGRNFENIPGF